jgi:ubiquinone/menaquinone biosynthesis C-methylase UbiE
LIGKRDKLHEVYRAALQQATRVCVPGGRYAVLTQEIQLFEDVLKSFTKDWRIEASFRVKQSDYKPKLYLLKRERGS